ncbi:MAG: trehalose-phosphatase [Rudaea sp.]
MLSKDSDRAILDSVLDHLNAGERVHLFLDYDGTLVPIARTPEEALPAPALLELLSRLTRRAKLRVMILSGRPLAWLQQKLPVQGLWLGGTYGTELQLDREAVTRCDSILIRPKIEQIRNYWMALVGGRDGFLVEDKGLAVALHARFAEQAEAELVLREASKRARELLDDEHFRILGGDRFLEAAPVLAHKGQTVASLLDHESNRDVLPVYIGDDDKDEEAFAVIRERGGLSIAVGPPRGPTQAVARFESPAAVRAWLRHLAD